MSEDNSELETTLNDLKRLAREHTWRPPPDAPVELRVITVDPPDYVSLDAIKAFCLYAKQQLDVTVSLLGGGYGCFHLDFTASKGDDSILENAILNDNRFQSLLNDLNAHAVLVITKNISRTYCAVHEVKLAFATNRDLQTPSYNIEDGVTGLFGAEGSEDTTYGLAEVDVQDLTKGQSKENLLKRVWRLLTVTSHH